MLSLVFVYSLVLTSCSPLHHPEVYYGNQAKGTNFYRMYLCGRGVGSLFKVAKNIAFPFMKNVVLPVVKDEASQLLKDVASRKSLKNSLKSSAKRTGKRVILKF